MTINRHHRARPFTLPAIRNPHKYAGLYVYDFGTHVSVGYTAAEVRILRESQAHREGTAYEIYRIGEKGTIELRAVFDNRLGAQEAMCFLRADAGAARTDYNKIKAAADRDPTPCAVEMQLALLDAFDPPNVTALSYPASATTVMAGWLSENAADAGDRVIGGIDVHSRLTASDGPRIASCRLTSRIGYEDRSTEEVLQTVNEPVQR
jgi:hypothetical protein